MNDATRSQLDEAKAARQSAALEDLTEAGLRIVRAMAADAADPRTDAMTRVRIAGMYVQASRAIRLCIHMELRLDEQPGLEAPAAPQARPGTVVPWAAAKARHERPREPAAELDTEAPIETLERAERVSEAREERLLDADEFADFDRQPIGAWVAGVSKEFGVAYDAALWEGPKAAQPMAVDTVAAPKRAAVAPPGPNPAAGRRSQLLMGGFVPPAAARSPPGPVARSP